jgi:hypothetical protein
VGLYILRFEFQCHLCVERLTQKHDGQYLAKVTADCLDRFGLAELVCLSFSLFCDPENLSVALVMYG